jgi:hypothetical protein
LVDSGIVGGTGSSSPIPRRVHPIPCRLLVWM